MNSVKVKNVVISLGILTAWICIVVILAALSKSGGNNISLFYIWTRLSGLVSAFGGLMCLALRIFKAIDRHTNIWYAFLAVSNSVIGSAGVLFHFYGKINVVGLHDLLPNLLIGAVMITDLFVGKPKLS